MFSFDAEICNKLGPTYSELAQSVRALVQSVHSEVVQVEAIVYKVSVYSMATPQGGRA